MVQATLCSGTMKWPSPRAGRVRSFGTVGTAQRYKHLAGFGVAQLRNSRRVTRSGLTLPEQASGRGCHDHTGCKNESATLGWRISDRACPRQETATWRAATLRRRRAARPEPKPCHSMIRGRVMRPRPPRCGCLKSLQRQRQVQARRMRTCRSAPSADSLPPLA